MSEGEEIPQPGQWPVDPQEDVPVEEDRIWVDGCFDFAHHGHAGAMLQARQLGAVLFAGVHSDEAILKNKGPTVMTLAERIAAVDACRWVTKSVPYAPYVTSLPWITHYGCKYVVHGDDITSDSDGNDCYRFVKAAGRFKIVKRTPGISTTDLVGRMLLCTRGHFILSLEAVLAGKEGHGSAEERQLLGQQMLQRIRDYASDETGLKPGCEVWSWRPAHARPHGPNRVKTDGSQELLRVSSDRIDDPRETKETEDGGGIASTTATASGATLPDSGDGSFHRMISGVPPRPDQRIVYVDGGFDLFGSGHIEFLKRVTEAEEQLGRSRDWYSPSNTSARIAQTGSDYPPCFVIAGVHDDAVINDWKGVNYPIMNLFERSLCVLQCRYVHALAFSAPFVPTATFLHSLPYLPSASVTASVSARLPAAVYHGPTSFMPLTSDPYAAAKTLGIFVEVPMHQYAHVNAGEIVQRIMRSRARYEERQRAKGVKGVGESEIKARELRGE